MASREIPGQPRATDNHLPKEIVVSSTRRQKGNPGSGDVSFSRSNSNFSPGVYQSVLQDFKKPWRMQPKDVLVSYYKTKRQAPQHYLALSES